MRCLAQVSVSSSFARVIDVYKRQALGILHQNPRRHTWSASLLSLIHIYIAYCFDVSPTDGADLPEGPARQLTGSVDGYAHIWDTLLAVSPVPVSIEPITGSDANGYYSHSDQRIVVRDGLAELQRVKTAIHEIAHALLHDKGAEEADSDRSTCILYTSRCV